MAGLTLDTGALVALERYRRDMVKVVETARQAGATITVPANVLAEWWRGRTDRRDYVRKMFVVQDVDEKVAKLAGEAMSSLKRRRVVVDDRVTIDATVMATAALCGPELYTGNFDDMDLFGRFFPSVKLFGLTAR
jgi:predicted nucleic acid-binding protein